MSDAMGGEAATVTTEAAVEAAVSSPPAERDYEAEARQQGWKPKEEFSGNPDDWRDAKTFVDYGDIAKRVEKRFETRLQKMERTHEHTVRELQRQHADEIGRLTATRREAIKAGDVDKVEQIDQKIDDLKASKPEAETSEPKKGSRPKADSPEHKALVKSFISDNPWFVAEPEMGEYAEKFSQRNAEANDGISFEDNAEATVAAVRKKFPDYFKDQPEQEGKAAANGHAAVDGGGNYPGTRRADPLAKLPNEARAQCLSDMKAFPAVYPTKEAWIKVYDGNKAA